MKAKTDFTKLLKALQVLVCIEDMYQSEFEYWTVSAKIMITHRLVIAWSYPGIDPPINLHVVKLVKGMGHDVLETTLEKDPRYAVHYEFEDLPDEAFNCNIDLSFRGGDPNRLSHYLEELKINNFGAGDVCASIEGWYKQHANAFKRIRKFPWPPTRVGPAAR